MKICIYSINWFYKTILIYLTSHKDKKTCKPWHNLYCLIAYLLLSIEFLCLIKKLKSIVCDKAIDHKQMAINEGWTLKRKKNCFLNNNKECYKMTVTEDYSISWKLKDGITTGKRILKHKRSNNEILQYFLWLKHSRTSKCLK